MYQNPNGSGGGDGDLMLGGAPFTLDLDPPSDPSANGGGGGTPPEGGTAGGEGGGEGGTPGAAPIPDNIARMIADTTRRATEAEQRATQAERAAEELRRSAQQAPQQWTGQQPNQQQIREQLARTLNDRFMQNPGETLADLLLASRTIADQSAQSVASGLAPGTADLIISGFKQERQGDPSWNIVKDTFEQMLEEARSATAPEQLARATPQQIRTSLENIYERAAGRAALGNLAQRSRQNTPPAYNTGSAGAAGGARMGSGGAHGQDELSPRDAIEQELLSSARSYNMKDEHILAALRAHREDH